LNIFDDYEQMAFKYQQQINQLQQTNKNLMDELNSTKKQLQLYKAEAKHD